MVTRGAELVGPWLHERLLACEAALRRSRIPGVGCPRGRTRSWGGLDSSSLALGRLDQRVGTSYSQRVGTSYELTQRPRSRPMSSFMISLEPAQILETRASRQARATRYSFMKP